MLKEIYLVYSKFSFNIKKLINSASWSHQSMSFKTGLKSRKIRRVGKMKSTPKS